MQIRSNYDARDLVVIRQSSLPIARAGLKLYELCRDSDLLSLMMCPVCALAIPEYEYLTFARSR